MCLRGVWGKIAGLTPSDIASDNHLPSSQILLHENIKKFYIYRSVRGSSLV